MKEPKFKVGQEVVFINGFNECGIIKEVRNVVGTKFQSSKNNVWDYLILITTGIYANKMLDWWEEEKIKELENEQV